MTTKQFRTNLNCGSCVAAVKPHLDAAPGIHHWSVDTQNPDKLLTVAGDDVSPQQVRELVSRAGFQVLGEADPKPPATSYYPLALLVSFLLGLVAIAEWRAGGFDIMRAMSHFMGGFFVAFSFFKLLDVPAFADAYQSYDLVAARSRAYALAYPFIELSLGIAYLTNAWPMMTNLVTFVIMTVSSLGVIQSLVNRRSIRCACLGTVFNLPMSTVTLLEDGLMAGMAALMLIWPML